MAISGSEKDACLYRHEIIGTTMLKSKSAARSKPTLSARQLGTAFPIESS